MSLGFCGGDAKCKYSEIRVLISPFIQWTSHGDDAESLSGRVQVQIWREQPRQSMVTKLTSMTTSPLSRSTDREPTVLVLRGCQQPASPARQAPAFALWLHIPVWEALWQKYTLIALFSARGVGCPHWFKRARQPSSSNVRNQNPVMQFLAVILASLAASVCAADPLIINTPYVPLNVTSPARHFE